jgi:hypothetical protein
MENKNHTIPPEELKTADNEAKASNDPILTAGLLKK